MADGLPDGFTVDQPTGGAGGLPEGFAIDQPHPDSGQRTWLGLKTPQDLGQAPERPEGYLNTWQQFHDEAQARINRGLEQLTPTRPQPTWSGAWTAAKEPITRGLPGAYNVAAGAIQRTIAPATAAFRNYVSVPVERATGLPAEELETGLQMGAPCGAPLGGLRPRAVSGVDELAARTAPNRGSPLSLPGTLQRPPVVDMGELERAISPEAAPSPAPATGAASELPEAAPRENLGIRLLQPDVPHDLAPRGRASVGAAGVEADPLAEYSPQTIQRARELLADSGLDNPHRLEQALEEVSPHHTSAELTPALEKEVSGMHAADKGVAKNTIAQTYLERAREAPQRMSAAFDRAFGQPQNTAELTRDIEAERARTATPLWRQFIATPVAPTPELRAMLPRLDAAGALKAANKAMREEGLSPQQGFARTVTDEAGEWAEQVEHMPTAAAFQYAKEHLDGLIEKSLASPGEAKAARRYTQLKNDLVSAIDRHPDPQVAGVWQAARRAWQQPTELLEAQKIGRRLLTGNVDREDVPFLTAGWSPERMEHLNVGIRNYLEDLEKGNRSPARTSNKLLDAVLSPGNQDKLRAVLGDERANQLIDAIGHEERMHRAPTRIIGGSPTAERQAARDRYTAEGQGAVGKGLSKIGGYLRHPVRSAAAEGVEALARRVSTKQEREMAQLRDELSRIMTAQGPERNTILRALIGAEEPPPTTWARPGGIVPPQGAAAPAAAARAPEPAWSAGGWRPVSAEEIAAARARPTAAPEPAVATGAAQPKGRSLLEFLASKGGLNPTPDLVGILGGNRFLGRHGWILRKGGMTEDQAREAAAEAGYLVNEGRGGGPNAGGGTSTIRDLHEAINDEQRGRKRYAMGEERTAAAVDPDEERRHIEAAVADHFDEIGAVPDDRLRNRVIELIEKERLSPDIAHERASLEESNAGSNNEIPAVSAPRRIPMESGQASKKGVSSAAGQRQPAGGGPRESPRRTGEAHPEEAQRGHGLHLEQVERQQAVRRANDLGLTERIQQLALHGKSDAEIFKAIGQRLTERDVRLVRHHLGIGPVSDLMGDDDIPFARGGAVRGARPPMSTRKQSNYSPTRGKPDHHCGPDRKWPHGFCSMFREHNKCTAVGGFIATKGGCDWWREVKDHASANAARPAKVAA